MIDDSKIYIYPTDTVWGIGASIDDENACKCVKKIKRVDEDKPNSILFPSLNSLKEILNLDGKFLEKVFSLFKFECAIGFDNHFFNKEIGTWVKGLSSFTVVRYLGEGVVEDMFDNKVNFPITTTSLNISGDEPIYKKDDAIFFCKEQGISMERVFDTEKLTPSGESSTIVLFDKNKNHTILREGKNLEIILKELSSL